MSRGLPAKRSTLLFVAAAIALVMMAVVGGTPEAHAKTNRMDRGFCTWYAAERFNKIAPEPGANWLGNASQWFAGAKNSGWAVSSAITSPQVGAVVVWGGGLGHVGVVDSANAQGITISEMNWGPAFWNKVTRATLNWTQISRRNGHPFVGYIYPWRAGSNPPTQPAPPVLPVPAVPSKPAATATPMPTATPTPKASPATPTSSPISQIVQVPNARYVGESAPYDNDIISRNQGFTKRWTIQNNGRSVWSKEDYRARRVSGNFGPDTLGLPHDVQIGDSVNISTSLVSPSLPGIWEATYRLEGPNGQFGHTFWVQIVVK